MSTQRRQEKKKGLHMAMIGLSGGGLAISVYLWRAKAGATELVCGTLGDCVTVNASAYSEIGGLPVAFAGAAMYAVLLIFGLLLWPSWTPFRNIQNPAMIGFTVALAGALFSLYLTLIEAFVLRAYCIWCLVSWVIITVLAFCYWRFVALLPGHN